MWKWYPKTGTLQLDSLAGNDPLSEEFAAVTSWKKIVHQSDRKRLEVSLRRFEDSGYKVFDCAFRLSTTIPQWVHARDMYHVYGPDGSPAMVAGLFFDITESELAKEKMYWGKELPSLVQSGAASWLRMLAEFDRHQTDSGRIAHLRDQCGYEFDSLFQKSNVPCFKKNARFEFTEINEAFETLTGLTAKEVLHHTDEEIHGKEVGARTRRIYRNVLKQEQGEVTFHHLDIRGKSSFFILECYPDWGPDHRVQGINGVLLPLSSEQPSEVEVGPKRGRMSTAMQALNLKIQLAARCDSIILLTGESGSGKDYMAHRIHELSSRADQPFLNLNCGGFSSGLIESELFGHEQGAFTSASKRKKGFAELAADGTLFLNEIGEIPLELQPKLLTFLDNHTFYRVGGEAPLKSKARIIAATNRNLRHEVEKGRFRQDLYYRLSVFPIQVPPLRERIEELPALIQNLLERIAADMGLPEKPELQLDAMQRIQNHRWPGNIRELRNVLERAIIHAQSNLITDQHIVFEAGDSSFNAQDGTVCTQKASKGKQKSEEVTSGDAFELAPRTGKPSPDEMARLYKKYIVEKGWSREQLAKRLGKHSSTVKKWFKEAGFPAGDAGRPKKKRVD
jgi:PAS domain S-box-containing protein